MVTLDRWQRYSEDYRVKRPVLALCASLVPELLKNAFLFVMNKNQVPISMVQVFSIQDLFMPKNSDLLTKNKFLVNQ